MERDGYEQAKLLQSGFDTAISLTPGGCRCDLRFVVSSYQLLDDAYYVGQN